MEENTRFMLHIWGWQEETTGDMKDSQPARGFGVHLTLWHFPENFLEYKSDFGQHLIISDSQTFHHQGVYTHPNPRKEQKRAIKTNFRSSQHWISGETLQAEPTRCHCAPEMGVQWEIFAFPAHFSCGVLLNPPLAAPQDSCCSFISVQELPCSA